MGTRIALVPLVRALLRELRCKIDGNTQCCSLIERLKQVIEREQEEIKRQGQRGGGGTARFCAGFYDRESVLGFTARTLFSALGFMILC